MPGYPCCCGPCSIFPSAPTDLMATIVAGAGTLCNDTECDALEEVIASNAFSTGGPSGIPCTDLDPSVSYCQWTFESPTGFLACGGGAAAAGVNFHLRIHLLSDDSLMAVMVADGFQLSGKTSLVHPFTAFPLVFNDFKNSTSCVAATWPGCEIQSITIDV